MIQQEQDIKNGRSESIVGAFLNNVSLNGLLHKV